MSQNVNCLLRIPKFSNGKNIRPVICIYRYTRWLHTIGFEHGNGSDRFRIALGKFQSDKSNYKSVTKHFQNGPQWSYIDTHVLFLRYQEYSIFAEMPFQKDKFTNDGSSQASLHDLQHADSEEAQLLRPEAPIFAKILTSRRFSDRTSQWQCLMYILQASFFLSAMVCMWFVAFQAAPVSKQTCTSAKSEAEGLISSGFGEGRYTLAEDISGQVPRCMYKRSVSVKTPQIGSDTLQLKPSFGCFGITPSSRLKTLEGQCKKTRCLCVEHGKESYLVYYCPSNFADD